MGGAAFIRSRGSPRADPLGTQAVTLA
ncbi:MAG: hypothetical protein QOI74_2116, partial [Micromonosporaceae bacterium]|nr:hypothetical protein [Micromonosporaceae bacterium]